MQQAVPPHDSIVESNTTVVPSLEEEVKAAAQPPDSAVESNTTAGREYIFF